MKNAKTTCISGKIIETGGKSVCKLGDTVLLVCFRGAHNVKYFKFSPIMSQIADYHCIKRITEFVGL